MQGIPDFTGNAQTRGPVQTLFGPGVQAPLQTDVFGNLAVVQGLPERSELVRQGNSWVAMPLVAQASTLLVAQPTTAFATALVNNDLSKSYIIDRVFYFGVTAMAAAQPAGMIYAIVPNGNPIPTLTGTVLVAAGINNLNGKAGAYAGSAVIKGAGAITALPAVTAGAWYPLGNCVVAAPTTNLGIILEAQCYGKYVIRPGASFLMNAIGGTAAGTFGMGVEWHEAQVQIN